MSNLAIRVEHLSKRYRIGLQEEQRDTLAAALLDLARRPIRNLRRLRRLTAFDDHSPSNDSPDIIWALKDISFEVQRGEVVGVIGRNGAGKSTLLKILSRITHPTDGRVEIHGRVSSLLEVGTGFHPELTGRENVYLNGTILGMRKTEIDHRFDEIVDFSGVEKFIDTPVKFYSSGMRVRLAFSVAAHLEPEVLLVDEVLAVGDARFQKKCLNKMQNVGRQGRTVLFVSHSMPAITRLCKRTILLDEGSVISDGPSPQVVGAYLHSGMGTMAAREWPDLEKAPGNDIVRLCAVRVRSEDGHITDTIDIRKPFGVEIEFEVLQPGHELTPNLHFFNDEGINVFITAEVDPAWRGQARPVGRYTSTVWIPGNFLAEGTLIVTAAVSTLNPVIVHFHELDVIAFQVIDSLEGDSVRGDWAKHFPGVIRPLLPWKTQYTPAGWPAGVIQEK
ncbi:MAG: ABC transporter ATP-binding protein [Anaerolineales bacterium]|nr:ABC transporter ATP-binding protein [Anaerolineales bacterium]